MTLEWNIEGYDTVHSTQDIVKGMAALGQPEGVVVHALEQTGGRGRHGREWISEQGNLYLSILLRPSCQARQIGQLSVLTGVALVRAIRPFFKTPSSLTLKWPNDVLINKDKCAGILIETELAGEALSYAAVGIGVNVACAPKGLGTALNEHSKKFVEINILRDAILKELKAGYSQWSRTGFDEIRQEWLRYAHPPGTPLRIKIGPQIETGRFYSLDGDGNLLLTDSDLRQKKVTAGEVYLI